MAETRQLDVYPKFKQLLRPLSQDERQRLEWSILKDGILDPIKVWQHEDKTYIIDGHNRYEIYQTHAADIKGGYTTLDLAFESEEDALEWIIENQLRRRNLNNNERVLYLGQLFEMRKKRRGGLAKTEEGGATAEIIAKEHDVSTRTVTRAAEVAQAYNTADVEMQEKFASGELSQAEFLREIKKKAEPSTEKRDKLHNPQTVALAAIGERLSRAIKNLKHQSEDFVAVCTALKITPESLAPAIAQLRTGLVHEEALAEALTTIVDVGDLCPNKDADETCAVCNSRKYITEAAFKPIKEHFGFEPKQAKTASQDSASAS